MTTPIRYTAVAVFDSREQAEKAIAALREEGFRDDQLGVACRPPEPSPRKDQGGQPPRENVPAGTAVGMLVGASLGGLVAGVGSVPGAALGGVLAGLVEGAVAGGLLGALIGLGVPEAEAHYYQRELDAGRTIVTVNAGDRYEQAQEILLVNGGQVPQSPLSQVGPGILP